MRNFLSSSDATYGSSGYSGIGLGTYSTYGSAYDINSLEYKSPYNNKVTTSSGTSGLGSPSVVTADMIKKSVRYKSQFTLPTKQVKHFKPSDKPTQYQDWVVCRDGVTRPVGRCVPAFRSSGTGQDGTGQDGTGSGSSYFGSGNGFGSAGTDGFGFGSGSNTKNYLLPIAIFGAIVIGYFTIKKIF
jgi:hypothetical protein